MEEIQEMDGLHMEMKFRNLGKQFIWNEIIASAEHRYARYEIKQRIKPMIQAKNLISIPIPFMKKDHGIYIF